MEPAINNKHRCVIKVTDFCQMKCNYCFATTELNKLYKKRHFNFVNEFFNFWDDKTLNLEDFSFSFFGGEPLLKFEEVVKPIILFIRKKSFNISIKITTNGLLLTEKILEFFNTYHIMLIISLDGSEKIFNINRVHKNKNINTFSKIINNYKLIGELPRAYPKQFFFGISSTFNPNSINHIIDSYEWALSLNPTPRFWHWNIDFTHSVYNNEQFEIILEQLKALYLFYKNSNKRVKIFYFDQIIDDILFNFTTGIVFSTSGRILFGNGTDLFNKNVERELIGDLKKQFFNKDLFKRLCEQEQVEINSHQYCLPLMENFKCSECKFHKQKKVYLADQRQRLLCLFQSLKEE